MSLLRFFVVSLAALFLFAGFATAGKEDHPHRRHDYDDYDYDDYDYDHDDYDYDDYHHPKIWGPKCYDKDWEWTYNSLGHHPCQIAAYLLSTCHGGSYYIPKLGPKGYDSCKDGECECNTVIYSLLSACEACQGGKWPYFKEYTKYCKKVLYPGKFPHKCPYGTKVPKWAFLDITVGDTWDPVKAKSTGCKPEVEPGYDMSG